MLVVIFECKPSQESSTLQFYVIPTGLLGLKTKYRGEITYFGANF